MIFTDFVEYDGWFDDAWDVMIFFLNLYDDAYMNAWMHGWNLLFFIFHFSFILIWEQGKLGLEARKKKLWGQTKLDLGANVETRLEVSVKFGLRN